MEFTVCSKGSHIELFASTQTVSYEGLLIVLRALATTVQRTGVTKALVHVSAPDRSVRFFDQAAIWSYAVERGLQGAQLAYVVAGRSLDSDTYFAETFSDKRGLRLKFFVRQQDALRWLLDAAATHERASEKAQRTADAAEGHFPHFLSRT